MISRIALVALAALVAVPVTTPAQERPTVSDMLQRFATTHGEALYDTKNDATELLRQVHGSLSAEEIEALIEGLVEIALDPDANACD